MKNEDANAGTSLAIGMCAGVALGASVGLTMSSAAKKKDGQDKQEK